MSAPSDLAPWASEVKVKNKKLDVSLRRGLDLNGVLNLLKTQNVSTIRALRVPGSVGLTGLRALFTSNRFASLTSVALIGFGDEDDAVDVVFDTRTAAQLRVLKVWGVSDAIDMRLARGDFVDSLRQLEVRSSPELTSLDRYFAGKRVGVLKFLTVHNSGLADASKLFQNPLCTELVSASFARCEVGADTIRALGASPCLNKLRKFALSYNRDNSAIRPFHELLRTRPIPKLETLSACNCQLESFDWSKVRLPELRKLDLRDNVLEADEIADILGALPKIEQLIINTPEGRMPPKRDRRVRIEDRRPRYG